MMLRKANVLEVRRRKHHFICGAYIEVVFFWMIVQIADEGCQLQ
jgi:hypothetical protein